MKNIIGEVAPNIVQREDYLIHIIVGELAPYGMIMFAIFYTH